MLTNLARAGLARLTNRSYAPLPTVYDGFFPKGTLLTAPKRLPFPVQTSSAICDHMNADHADAVLAYAHTFAGRADARTARMQAIDRRGMDLEIMTAAGTGYVRIPFERELRDADDARETLISMATRGVNAARE